MTWVHWVLYDLPADASGLDEDASRRGLPDGAREGLNDWKRTGYPDDLLTSEEFYYSGGIPRRLYYSDRESLLNPNSQTIEQQPDRNDNDPNLIY